MSRLQKIVNSWGNFSSALPLGSSASSSLSGVRDEASNGRTWRRVQAQETIAPNAHGAEAPQKGLFGACTRFVFRVRIYLGGKDYSGVVDAGATIYIVAKKILSQEGLKNTMLTAAIGMRDGHVVHSCADCDVEVPMGSRSIPHRFFVMDTAAFDFVQGTVGTAI